MHVTRGGHRELARFAAEVAEAGLDGLEVVVVYELGHVAADEIGYREAQDLLDRRVRIGDDALRVDLANPLAYRLRERAELLVA